MPPREKYAKIKGWLQRIYGEGPGADFHVDSHFDFHFKDKGGQTLLALAAFIWMRRSYQERSSGEIGALRYCSPSAMGQNPSRRVLSRRAFL
jgi:hypothetical protein